MAIRRTSSNSISNAVKLSTGFASAAIPNTPTIGTATAVSDVAATVEYTAAVLGATASTFTATSSPGSVTGTGSSPITVTGLTASTAYTFTVTAGNANGTSAASSASNSITTSAPSGSYQSIATVTVGSGGASSITFSSIPSTFTHLQIRASIRDARTTTINTLNMRVGNGSIDSGGNYSSHYLDGDGSSATSGAAGANYTSFAFLIEPSNSATSNAFGGYVIDLLDYKNANKYKTFRGLGGVDLNGSGNITLASGNWMSTSAITNIQFFNNGSFNFSQYSHFALYGIKGA